MINSSMWCDMCTLFKKSIIGIKGAKTYGLKDIAKSMYKNKLIKEIWQENVSDGVDAMITVWKISNETNLNLINDYRMNNIINYNKMDCKVLHDIMTYLRNNH